MLFLEAKQNKTKTPKPKFTVFIWLFAITLIWRVLKVYWIQPSYLIKKEIENTPPPTRKVKVTYSKCLSDQDLVTSRHWATLRSVTPDYLQFHTRFHPLRLVNAIPHPECLLY